MSARDSQREEILALLMSARGGWVPVPLIAGRAAQYNARIFELRRSGYRILNRTEDVEGQKHSWFRLERGSDGKPPSVTDSSPSPSVPSSFPEFGSLEPERYGA